MNRFGHSNVKENYRNREMPSDYRFESNSASPSHVLSASSYSSYPPLCRPNYSSTNQKKTMNLALFETLAPKCSGHHMPCKLLVVKNINSSNKGRYFYACSYPQEQQCKMFMWCEENPSFVAHSVQAAVDSRLQIQKHPLLKKLSPSQLFAFERYREKLEGMILDELKTEIRKINARRSNVSAFQSTKVDIEDTDDLDYDVDIDTGKLKGDKNHKALKIGGNKEQVMERLLLASVIELLSSSSSSLPSLPSLSTSQTPLPPLAVSSTESNLGSVHNNEDTIVLPTKSGHCEDETPTGFITLSDDDSDDDSDNDSIEIVDSYCNESGKTDEAESNGIQSVSTSIVSSTTHFTPHARNLLTTPENALRNYFGLSSFHSSQRWAIDRAIAPVPSSSLLVMPTGSGKSLCYMIPAACLPGITVVVSPLIALMQDEMKKLPVQIPAVCLSGNLDGKDMGKISTAITKGYVKIIYVSPERLCTDAFRSLIEKVRCNGNMVSLLAVDEAHCLSSWSYNFRPAFLRIRREITQSLLPQAILALTATAAPSVQRDICRVLHLNPEKDVHVVPSQRKNLNYYTHIIEHEEKRYQTILDLLQVIQCRGQYSSRDLKTKSIRDDDGGKKIDCTIVYVWRRDEAVSLSTFLKGSGISAGCYHAGMASDQRMNAQEAFFRGNISVMVATVAFGMGVDKADVRNVIHSSMPKSLENFVQETGRAGRDGLPASCHLILCKYDIIRQASLSYSPALSLVHVHAFLSHVFLLDNKNSPLFPNRQDLKVDYGIEAKDDLESTPQYCSYQCFSKVYIPISSLSSMDLTETAAETLLSILELPPFSLLTVEGRFKNSLKGKFRFHPTYLKDVKDEYGEPVIDFEAKCIRAKRLSARCLSLLQLLFSFASIKKRINEATSVNELQDDYKLQMKKKREERKARQGWFERENIFNIDDDSDDDASSDVDDDNSYDPLSFDLQLSDIVIAVMRPRDEVTLGAFDFYIYILFSCL